MHFYQIGKTSFIGLVLLVLSATMAVAHETWFLQPDLIANISSLPSPEYFSSPGLFAIYTIPFCLVFIVAVLLEPRWQDAEDRLFETYRRQTVTIAGVALSTGLAIMMLIAAFGLLPVMGTSGGKASLFVASAVLPSTGYWAPIVMALQIVLAAMLLSGFQTRIAALGVILLSLIGHIIFGWKFIDFSVHFVAPALILLATGCGSRLLFTDRRHCLLSPIANIISVEQAYRIARILTGLGFAFVAFRYKFLEPGFLLAILDMTILPDLGSLAEPVALGMGLIEIMAGLAIALGVLIRPVFAFLLFAFLFFTIILNESVFYHTQLFALSVVFLIGGAEIQTENKNVIQSDRRKAEIRPRNKKNIATSGLFAALALFLMIAVPIFNSNRLGLIGQSFQIAQLVPEPEISLTASQDTAGNWWLHIDTKQFEYSNKIPEERNNETCGHIHVMINNKKFATVMQPVVFLGPMAPGKHEIRAALRTADHRQITGENGPFQQKLEIVVAQRGLQSLRRTNPPV